MGRSWLVAEGSVRPSRQAVRCMRKLLEHVKIGRSRAQTICIARSRILLLFDLHRYWLFSKCGLLSFSQPMPSKCRSLCIYRRLRGAKYVVLHPKCVDSSSFPVLPSSCPTFILLMR